MERKEPKETILTAAKVPCDVFNAASGEER
jgi:hypothetical protein